jgi:Zn-dependent M28 family amino/carboxypeptidase
MKNLATKFMRGPALLLAAFALSALTAPLAHASDWSSAVYRKSSPRFTPAAADPVYQAVYDSVDRTKLINDLKMLAGVSPVTVGGSTYSISERYSPAMKAKFRAFWIQYFNNLGIPTTEMAYKTQHSVGEAQGHNVEAVLEGKSKSSIVIIVHYDSIGPAGDETGNAGVDDDMTGMATLLETARILKQNQAHLKYTVRFVAADYEEHASPGLEGAREYAKYIKALAAKDGFQIVSAVDDEQSGWNCMADGLCSDKKTLTTFDVFSCSGDFKRFDFPQIGDLLAETAATYSTLQVERGCIGENSDHYAMWEIGVPAVVFSEHHPFDNPHFDQNGGDTFDKIDQDYFFKIAQIGVTFAARLATLE